MNEQQQWYVTIAGNAVGPVSTDLVLRGIKHKKIATEAYVCVVGADEWQALTDVPEFHGALKEHGLLPEVKNLETQPHNGVETSLATMAAAQAEARQSQSPQLAQAEAMPLVNTEGAQSSVPQLEGADSLKNVEDEDESDTTAPFSSRRLLDLETAHAELSAAPVPLRDEQSEVTQVTALLSSRPVHDVADEAVGLLPSRPAPEVVIYEAADDPSIEAVDVTDEADSSESSIPSEPRNGKHMEVPLLSRPPMQSIDVDIDFSADEAHKPAIDWSHGFADYFLVDAEVTLPDEHTLLRSLASTSHETFLNDEAMWNLALCLAFGSNTIASVAADVFFDVVTSHEQWDRIEWVARTLLSRGFMPSGIPHPNGNMGIGRLRQACPPELLMQLESQLGL